jgi:histidinol-phosphate aminotransferase
VQRALTPRTKLIWLANPNNPTGTVFSKTEFEDLLAALPENAWVVLDEAYAEFAPDHELPDRATLLAREYRLIIVRTFSKAYGLAGARLGYAMAQPDMVTVIDTVSEPFNANRVGIAGGIAALSTDRAVAQKTLATMIADRDRMQTALAKMNLKVVPSQANFVFFETPVDAQELTMALFRKGFIVRPCTGWGFKRAIRVTVGTTLQVDRFLAVLEATLKAIL